MKTFKPEDLPDISTNDYEELVRYGIWSGKVSCALYSLKNDILLIPLRMQGDFFTSTHFKEETIMSETTNKKMGGKKIAILVAVFAVLVAAVAILYFAFGPKATKGAKALTIEVTDDQGETTEYELHTDAEFLRQAMEELAEANDDFSFEGTESDYGMMVDSVCGITADYNANGAYWSFYVNGEYCNYGIDEQPVADGETYTIVYTVD